MEDSKNKYTGDDWKIALRSEMINAFYRSPQEQEFAFERIANYYNYCAPKSLYKYYYDTKQNLDSVMYNKIWYSSPCNFNDVFDCDISIDKEEILKCALYLWCDRKKILPESQIWKFFEKITNEKLCSLQSTFNNAKNIFGVTCLSESYDSLLMWSHYANNHHGMCVEYELSKIRKHLGVLPFPVIYSNSKTCFNSISPGNSEWYSLKIIIHSITTKSPEWSYEKEWRLVRDYEACGDKWDEDKKGALIEMIRPSSIILGCATKSEFENEVKTFCTNTKINLYKMEKDKINYRLNKKSILHFEEAND